MDGQLTQPLMVLTAGASAFGLASLLWALRISDGARGAARKYREEAQKVREKLARSESVFSAHPGVVLVWEDDANGVAPDSWGAPSIYGSNVALMGLLRFTDDASSDQPAVRILEGLADLEARDGNGQDATLRERLLQLRQDGAPFSLTIIGPQGRFLEADGRTAGARAVLWITDTTIKGLEESGARSRLEEARKAIARDPMAFLEMLGKAPFPAWRMSGSGKLQWVNEAYLRVVGANSVDQVLDRQIMLDQVVASQAQKTVTGNIHTEDTRRFTVDNESRAMRVHMFPLSGGIGGMAFDVTQEETARETLDKHVRAHDETLNHVADAVAIFGHDRRLIFHNRAFAEMWGFDPGFLMEKPDHGTLLDRLRERRKLPARQDYAKWRAMELSYYQGEKSDVLEAQWDLPDGRTLRVTRQRHPLGGLLMLFKDITGELNLRSQFNEQIKVQTATLDNLHEAVVVFSGDGRLRLRNRAFEQMWQLDARRLADEPDFDAVIDDCARIYHNRTVWSEIKARVTNPSPDFRVPVQGEMKTSAGKYLTFLTQPLPDGATLIAFVDVTAARMRDQANNEKNEALATADRLKTEFVHNVSRQLRSPLTTILGYAEFLESERHGALAERQREHVRSILSAANNLSNLITDILDLAVVDAGRMDLDLSNFDLRAAVQSSVDMVVSSAESTKVKLETDIDPDVGLIFADERRIKQILFNLLTNSLRFTAPGDWIKVSAHRESDVILLTVADSGKGIPYDRQALAFNSFTSGDNRGAGLGLALVKRFVELHGGQVMLKSAPNSGTTVICSLPDSASPRHARSELELGPTAIAAQ